MNEPIESPYPRTAPEKEQGIKPSAFNPKVPAWLALAIILGMITILGVVPQWIFRSNHGAEGAKRIATLSNMKQNSTAIFLYASENHDRLPPAHRWVDATEPHRSKSDILRDLTAPQPRSFMFHEPLGGHKPYLLVQPSETPLLFQSDSTAPNAAGTLEDLPQNPRGGQGRDMYVFADGRVQVKPRSWAAAHRRVTFK